MSEAINQWLASRPMLEQVIGCGVCSPGETPFVRSSSDELPDEVLQQLFSGIAEMVATVGAQAQTASKLRWVFQECLCHAVPRADGTCLMLLTTKEFGSGDALDQLANEFKAL